MRRITYILTAFAGLASACNSPDGKTDLSSTFWVLPEPDIRERLDYQRMMIDTFFNQNKDKLLVYAKPVGEEESKQITDGRIPKNVEVAFNVLKNDSGKIVTASEFPFSKSGDWKVILTHYFDKDGKTFIFERQTNFFNSTCTDGVAYETRTEFYDGEFQLIDKKYKLVDEKNKALHKDSCQFPYNKNYKVSADIDKYLLTNGIKNSN